MHRSLGSLLIAALWLGTLSCQRAPADVVDGGADAGSDSDADTGVDTDADSDTGECPEVEWGSGLEVGQPVANWQHSGFIDSDDDGVVEEEEVAFSLWQIHCTGKQSLVVMVGDTSCQATPYWFEEVGDIEADIRAAEGVVFAAFTANYLAAVISVAHFHISQYFDGSYFTGEVPEFYYAYTPYTAVIDLETVEVIAKDDGVGGFLDLDDIMYAVNQAAND
jgi:hypothetical protein